MIRKISGVCMLVLVIATTACGRHLPLQIAPVQPVFVQNILPPLLPLIPQCWDPSLHSYNDEERFDNTMANAPVVFKIVDNKIVDKTKNIVCFGRVRPGGMELGPMISNHRSPTSDWVVSATFYVTGVNSNRTEGMVDDSPATLGYRRNYGWFTRCPC